MKELFNNLTPDQRRFALIGGASLLAVGIMLFLINGLSGVSFTVDKEARFARDLAKKEAAAIDIILENEYERHAFGLAATEMFGDDSIFGAVTATRTVFVKDLTDFALTRVDVTPPTVEDYDVTVPENLADACEKAIELEEETIDNYTKALTRVGANPEVAGVMAVLRDQAADGYIPAFERCE